MIDSFVMAALALICVLTALAIFATFAMAAWKFLLANDMQEVRWGYCFKQALLGFVVALFSAPKLGFAGALLVGWLTPLTVAFAWVVFERVAPQPQRQAVRVKR